MANVTFRLPAEWERHSAMLLAWPHEDSDWADRLEAVRHEYCVLIEAIGERQAVVVLTFPGDRSVDMLPCNQRNVHFVEVPFNDTWCRDYGPITLVSSGRRLALDFHFNGWGGKHPAELDNRVNSLLARDELFDRLDFRQYLFELEGGAIDSDGQGRILLNWHCLEARHPYMTRAEIGRELRQLLNVDNVLGIDMPPMSGDDTDGHIDTLARFISPDVIVYQTQRDAGATETLHNQLESMDGDDGPARKLIALPAAEGIEADLPASYANFLFVNGGCLVPAYGSDADEVARRILADALPERDIISVPAETLITQAGGPHCATMHIPAPLP